MSDLPVQVYVRDMNRETIGMLTSWVSLNVVARRNDVGTWTLVTQSPDEASLLSPPVNSAGQLTGNRGVILRREDDNGEPFTFFSGWLSKDPDIEHSGGRTTWTFTGYDDTRLLLQALCWPKPTAAANQQTDTHDRRTGPASNRIRDYFIVNVVTRMGVPGAAGGSQLNLGPSGVTQARFIGLLELAQTIAGRTLNFTVRQRDTDKALFLYQWLPQDKRLSVQFSPALGNVQSWKRTSTETAVNRVIIGAGGEMELRVFRQFQDTSDMAIWGLIEQFKDRRDVTPTDPNIEEILQADGLEFLDENKGRSTFTIDIDGTPDARPFVHFAPGDRVRAYIDQDENGQPLGLVDDLIEQIEFEFSAEGERGSVQIGKPDQTLDDRFAARLRLDTRRLSFLETNR